MEGVPQRRRVRKPPVYNMTGPAPGPWGRRILLVLWAARWLGCRPLTVLEIARVIQEAWKIEFKPLSVRGALSGMGVSGGRYWIQPHRGPLSKPATQRGWKKYGATFRRAYTITPNGLAWL